MSPVALPSSQVDVPLAEAPLSAHAHAGNAARLDQSVHRAQVDVEVFEDLLGRQEGLVGGKVQSHWFRVPWRARHYHGQSQQV